MSEVMKVRISTEIRQIYSGFLNFNFSCRAFTVLGGGSDKIRKCN